MKVKEFIKQLSVLNPEDNIFFEVLGDNPDGSTGRFPLGIKNIYRCEEKGVAIEFEDN